LSNTPTHVPSEQERLLTERIRLQDAMIELLNGQLRRERAEVERLGEDNVELRRLIRVRDDMLYLRGQEIDRLRAGFGAGLQRWADRLRGKAPR
jgi:hypothetical protein